MLQRLQNHVGFGAQVTDAHLGEDPGDAFVDLPVAARFPRRIDGGGERVNKRVHVRGIHIVFFVPGGSRQDDIGEQTGAGHAEVERHQQIELALDGSGLPFDLFRLHVVCGTQIITLNAALGAEQVFQHVLVTFPGRAKKVRAPDKQVTRVVLAVIGLLAGEANVTRF